MLYTRGKARVSDNTTKVEQVKVRSSGDYETDSGQGSVQNCKMRLIPELCNL
jgi:hypothetical protein